jgi:hypothetical protein
MVYPIFDAAPYRGMIAWDKRELHKKYSILDADDLDSSAIFSCELTNDRV